ncbi:MAG: amidohydrolase family protein [Sphingomonas sp.]|nr:amidohydrolase family protein [Sphingomonas sp.]
MRALAGTALGLILGASAAMAQVPVDQLAKPPADAKIFSILSSAGKHGTVWEWTAPDGTLMARMNLVLRGQVWDEDEAIKLGADGAISDYTLRGNSPNGDVAESFHVANGVANWKSPIDGGSKPYAGAAYYLPFGLAPRAGDISTEALTANPGKDVALLPGGRAHIEKLATTTVGAGATEKSVTLWAITGIAGTPGTIWTDDKGKIFANVGVISFMPAGYEGEADKLKTIQDNKLAEQSPILARTLARDADKPVAFVDVRAFLDGTHFAEHQTVVVAHGKIAAVGAKGRVAVPKDAIVYQGAGKTLVPGLWDSHMHIGDDYSGPQELSIGVTSVRDPGNDDQLTVARRKRRADGNLLSPHVYASSLIDGKGPNTAQVANVVTSEAEAVKMVDTAKAIGQTGVKFYGTFNPAWVAPAAAEAHKLGLHVHGHLPAGMRPSEAIAAGYDELTHIYFVSMEAMPDDVVKTSNGINRFSGTGRYMKDVDLDAPPLKSLIATMAAKHIYSDPTLVVVESLFVPENGDLSPAYAPYLGTMPPVVERGFRAGGFVPPAGVTRADYRASFAKEQALVGKMHKAGVPIVAGTDGIGIELVRELELYVGAGFTPGEALQAATIVPARLVGADGHTGTIAVGKDADLVLVDGDPSTRIGDLRHTRIVLMDGKVMEADKLRAAVGFSAIPAWERAE